MLETVQIDEDEIDYLIEVANSYFKRQLSREDVISTYSGVRPLIDEEGKDATKVSRDYHLEPHKSTVPLLSIYGGKVTTYRTLAEDVMRALAPTFPKWVRLGRSWLHFPAVITPRCLAAQMGSVKVGAMQELVLRLLQD